MLVKTHSDIYLGSIFLFRQSHKLTMHKVTDSLACNYCHKSTIVMLTEIQKNSISMQHCKFRKSAQLCWQWGLFTWAFSYTNSISCIVKVLIWSSGNSGMDCPAAPSCGIGFKCNIPSNLSFYFGTAASSLLLSDMPGHLWDRHSCRVCLTWSWCDLSDLLVKYLDGRFQLF